MNWWHDKIQPLADQLSKGILAEMKRRILTSNIQKEKLELNEDTARMRQFFEREICRYQKRKQYVQNQKQQDHMQLIRQLVECNISLARKCAKNKIPLAKISIDEETHTWY